MTLIALFKVIASIYLQCATKKEVMVQSKEVVKKKYKNSELRNQSLVLLRDFLGYPSTELRQSSEKTKQKKIRIPLSNFFGSLEL